ncbi:aminodeoxychorismate lyase [Atlantibacter hermannii]|uniref:aminodeoxychorismate lyase n=1 Tax=Atlantibacter hermannii TaxID=565 RepID=UPI002896FA9A|nr:aminodeoxychorismate lyase [Atlantibacter hermannii]
MLLINGTWQDSLAANDRAIQFGDGCFTTARVKEGEIMLLDAHLNRLAEACARLAIPSPDLDLVRDEMCAVAESHAQAMLKVIVTRGAGGRGYSAAGCGEPSRLLAVSTYPAFYHAWREQGIRLTQSPVQLGRNPLLAGLKHLNRLEQVLIRRHLDTTDAQEALVLDSEGWLIECCAANIFWRKGNHIFTPRLDQAGVNGLMRQHILALLAQSPWQVEEVNALASELETAEEVFICNALMPLVPVNQAMQTRYLSRDAFRYLAPLCE